MKSSAKYGAFLVYLRNGSKWAQVLGTHARRCVLAPGWGN
jgi:hypothetical protein